MISERVYTLRKSLNLTQIEFGEKIGLKPTAVSYMEKGKSVVTEGNIKLICSVYNVSEIWLRTGKGDMFVQPTSLYKMLGFKAETLSPEVERIMLNFLSMSEEEQIALIETVKKLVEGV